MPCDIDNHNHVWPHRGKLTIEKCERFCAYCDGDAAKHYWKFPWFLRRHVRAVHLREGTGIKVELSEGWSGRPNGIPRAKAARSKRTKSSRATSDKKETVREKRDKSSRKAAREAVEKIVERTPDQSATSPSSITDSAYGPTDDEHDDKPDGDEDAEEAIETSMVMHTGGDPVTKRSQVYGSEIPGTPSALETKKLDVRIEFRRALDDMVNQGLDAGIGHFDIATIFAHQADVLADLDRHIAGSATLLSNVHGSFVGSPASNSS